MFNKNELKNTRDDLDDTFKQIKFNKIFKMNLFLFEKTYENNFFKT